MGIFFFFAGASAPPSHYVAPPLDWTANVSKISHFVKQFVVDEMEHFSDLVEMGALDYMDPEYTRQYVILHCTMQLI